MLPLMANLDLKRPDIPAITSLRFFAAIYVVIHHSAPASWRADPQFNNFLLNGNSSVEVFFLLSGLILTYVHFDSDTAGKFAIARFYAFRVARIYPVYFLGLALFMPFIVGNLIGLHGSLNGALPRLALYGISSAALVQAWIPKLSLAWNGPGWSLSAEAFFYAVFPFLLPFLARMKGFALAGAWLLLWVWSAAPLWIADSMPGLEGRHYWILYLVEFNPLLRLSEFLAGIMIGLQLIGRTRVLSGMADSGAAGVSVVLALTAYFAGPAMEKLLLFNEAAAFLYLLAIADGPFVRLMSSRALVLLGGASYSMYILHVPIYQWFVFFADRPAAFLTSGQDALPLPEAIYGVYIVTVTVSSVACYLLFEKPASHHLRRAWRSWPPRSVLTA